jgi:hypothetical protein
MEHLCTQAALDLCVCQASRVEYNGAVSCSHRTSHLVRCFTYHPSPFDAECTPGAGDDVVIGSHVTLDGNVTVRGIPIN